MPLFEKTRVEIYIPDSPKQIYKDLVAALEREMTYSFGGCTTVHGLLGNFRSESGEVVQDTVNLVYTGADMEMGDDFLLVFMYTDRLKTAAFKALQEEAILVVAYKVHHAI